MLYCQMLICSLNQGGVGSLFISESLKFSKIYHPSRIFPIYFTPCPDLKIFFGKFFRLGSFLNGLESLVVHRKNEKISKVKKTPFSKSGVPIGVLEKFLDKWAKVWYNRRKGLRSPKWLILRYVSTLL